MSASTLPPRVTRPRIARESLMTLEAYARERPAFRARVLEHKRNRSVHLGEHVTLIFEDELTIRYQIQEMLRIEKTFDEAGIQDELDAYAPLVPDGSNLKATMLVEYEDEGERRAALARLKGIQDCVWLRVGGMAAVTAIADEDLPREDEDKTSAVHFLRFEFAPDMIAALATGGALALGVDHPHYRAEAAQLPESVRAALVADLA